MKIPAASTALMPQMIQIMNDLRLILMRTCPRTKYLILKEDGFCGRELRWLSMMGRRRCERLCLKWLRMEALMQR
jgi:hypothetical protein